jgi:hypothetical protein
MSVEPRPTGKVNIHNQCSNFKLTDRKCFSSGADWNDYSAQEIDTGSMMSVEFKSPLAIFEGALMYKLQRENVESDNQSESTYTLLLAAWKSVGYKTFSAFVQLIACNKAFPWHKIDPEEYYQRYTSQLNAYVGSIKDTWLMGDNTVLMTGLALDFMQRDGVLNITISEGIRDGHTKRPTWMNPKR